MWFSLVEDASSPPGRQQQVDLNLVAPHRDLLLRYVQPDWLIQARPSRLQSITKLIQRHGARRRSCPPACIASRRASPL
jgi:hypothetical protein